MGQDTEESQCGDKMLRAGLSLGKEVLRQRNVWIGFIRFGDSSLGAAALVAAG